MILVQTLFSICVITALISGLFAILGIEYKNKKYLKLAFISAIVLLVVFTITILIAIWTH